MRPGNHHRRGKSSPTNVRKRTATGRRRRRHHRRRLSTMKPLFSTAAAVLPRFSLAAVCRPTTSAAARLAQCLISAQQHRSASILSSLSDVPAAYNKRIRRGRGPSSGKGKTSGRGHKGQKQHGKVPAGFNGGQTPDEVVAGKRGFTNVYVFVMASILAHSRLISSYGMCGFMREC